MVPFYFGVCLKHDVSIIHCGGSLVNGDWISFVCLVRTNNHKQNVAAFGATKKRSKNAQPQNRILRSRGIGGILPNKQHVAFG